MTREAGNMAATLGVLGWRFIAAVGAKLEIETGKDLNSF
jgi:hypothetical protein